MRWGTVLTANEPAALVETNVRWHLATGASLVFVFLDDPDDPAADRLSAIPGCVVRRCDEGYWRVLRPHKGRPASQMRRQTINANWAQNQCDLDWLFHIDADEFIWQDSDLAAELAAHDDPQSELNLPVFERLFPDRPQATLFDGQFRATSDLADKEAETAFGPFTCFMKRGQYSHGAGKSGVQVGAGLRLGVHNATRKGSEGRQRRAGKRVSTAARLLHFDGITPLHWLAKALRYRQSPPEVQAAILQPHRAAQIEWLLDNAANPEQALKAHHALFGLSAARRTQLARFDLLREVPFDPALVLGTACPDLSVEGFDADLMRRNPELAGVIGA
ncbi:glycosyltransferase family 2 protein [Tateyamaria sp. syn59]|uniref:glycosyltransferase family 2 protein n=1 Tax=Tateyamaria sp. syn59 TaxID=2576942 RepID=UPI00167B0C7D|nr:glycosyltransferase family 2 protein [Tateyamaria sp. syn59]